MIDALIDNAALVQILLGIVLVTILALWWSRRSQQLLYAVGVVVALMAVVLLLSLIVDTDSKRLRRLMDQMVNDFNNGRVDELLKNINDPLLDLGAGAVPAPITKAALQQRTSQFLKNKRGFQIEYSGLTVDKLQRPMAELSCWFRIKGESVPARAKMQFTLNAESKWHLSGFGMFRGAQEVGIPIP